MSDFKFNFMIWTVGAAAAIAIAVAVLTPVFRLAAFIKYVFGF